MLEKDTEEYLEQIRYLCNACGLAIDKIAKEFNINQNLVAGLFLQTFQKIIKDLEHSSP